MKALTQAQLREFLHYDPITGVFTWIIAPNKRSARGSVAGSVHKLTGYCAIQLCGKRYQAHRLAWFYVTGKWPKTFLDHKDNNRSNNSFSNLREATSQQNCWNRQYSGKSGLKGVYFDKDKWRAQITKDGALIHLGRFDDPLEAHEAYCIAAREMRGEFARVA